MTAHASEPADCFAYEHTDVSPGLTVSQWRRQRSRRARLRAWLRRVVWRWST